MDLDQVDASEAGDGPEDDSALDVESGVDEVMDLDQVDASEAGDGPADDSALGVESGVDEVSVAAADEPDPAHSF